MDSPFPCLYRDECGGTLLLRPSFGFFSFLFPLFNLFSFFFYIYTFWKCSLIRSSINSLKENLLLLLQGHVPCEIYRRSFPTNVLLTPRRRWAGTFLCCHCFFFFLLIYSINYIICFLVTHYIQPNSFLHRNVSWVISEIASVIFTVA